MKRLVVIIAVSFVLANLLTVFLPQTIGMETAPSWISSGDDQAGAWYGRSVSSAGDVNGDGYDDVIVGAYLYDTANSYAGKAYLYLGSESGLSITPSWTSSGDDQTDAYYGNSVSSAGDVNGDGYDDVIVGATYYDTANADAGKAYLYLGSAAGLASAPSWTSSGDDQVNARYGYSVSSAGDVNGDGYDDVIVGAEGYDTANINAGKAYLYLGSESGLSITPSWTSSGDDQAYAGYGYSVSSAGDVNGDGYDDVIVGADTYDTPNIFVGKIYYAGKAYLYLGSAAGLASARSWTSSGNNQAVACYGYSVSSAGDVNGDGYDDVIVGAYLYDTANTAAGKAYLYLGSSIGLYAAPSWTSSGDDQADARYGNSVSSAGDVNGDGYSDVIIGAEYYDAVNTNAGKAYLYLGSSSGLQASPSWTSSGDDQAGAEFGHSVASASDVNGDGYSDVIIGAYYYDTSNYDAGKAYLYLGVINQPPTCTISSPSNGSTVNGTITISGTASDIDGTVTQVQIKIDNSDQVIASGTTSWSYSWDTTKESNGNHTIYVRSYDGSDYSTIESKTVTVENEEDDGTPSLFGAFNNLLWVLLIVGIIIVIVIVIVAIKRKR